MALRRTAEISARCASVTAGADDGWNVQVAARALGGSDADGLVGEAHMRAVAIRLGVDGDGLNSQVFAGADDANGNFAPVSYTHLRAHETDSYLVCRLLL